MNARVERIIEAAVLIQRARDQVRAAEERLAIALDESPNSPFDGLAEAADALASKAKESISKTEGGEA